MCDYLSQMSRICDYMWPIVTNMWQMSHFVTIFIVVTSFNVFSIYFSISPSSLNGFSYIFLYYYLLTIQFIYSIHSDIFYLAQVCHSKWILHFHRLSQFVNHYLQQLIFYLIKKELWEGRSSDWLDNLIGWNLQSDWLGTIHGHFLAGSQSFFSYSVFFFLK